MTRLRGEALYQAAFARLKSGETHIVDTKASGFKFSTTTVAIEAGKQKGFIRAERYPDLCKKIDEAEEFRKQTQSQLPEKKKPQTKDRYSQLVEEHLALKEQYERCLERMLNLIKANYELKNENTQLRTMTNSKANRIQ